MQADKPETVDRPDRLRRRLARGGLAGTVVLGSLISRPVLGAVPYNCTISGQLSGNTSSHGAPVPCSTLGRSLLYWKGGSTELNVPVWPTPLLKGGIPGPICYPANSTAAGTRFNGYTNGATLASVFFGTNGSTSPAGTCTVGTANNGNNATMLQVLFSANTSEIFRLGRATIVSILNSLQPAIPSFGYPLTATQVITMFNAVYSGGTFQVNATTSWTRLQVITYFESLYPL